MPKEKVKVTRKGQITIPVEYRRKYNIREGMRVIVKEEVDGIILKPITPLEDLAGIDAGKIKLDEAKRKLDETREEDRY